MTSIHDDFLRCKCFFEKFKKFSNSSGQAFAFTAKAVRICKLGQKNLTLAEGDLEKLSFAQWADSVTGKPKAELLLL